MAPKSSARPACPKHKVDERINPEIKMNGPCIRLGLVLCLNDYVILPQRSDCGVRLATAEAASGTKAVTYAAPPTVTARTPPPGSGPASRRTRAFAAIVSGAFSSL